MCVWGGGVGSLLSPFFCVEREEVGGGLRDMRDYLFVYGTLKRGYGNHRYLEGASFIGEGETVEEYEMYDCGVPIVCKGRRVSKVKGELYEVDEGVLRRVDELEGHPYCYCRKRVRVEVGGKEYDAWMYFWVRPVRGGILLRDGEWKGRI